MLAFPNQVLFVRFGAAKCILPILLKYTSVDPQHITIMDFEPNEVALALDRAERPYQGIA
jgi:hypothetical protein